MTGLFETGVDSRKMAVLRGGGVSENGGGWGGDSRWKRKNVPAAISPPLLTVRKALATTRDRSGYTDAYRKGHSKPAFTRLDAHTLAQKSAMQLCRQLTQNMSLTPLCFPCHTWNMSWVVELADEFVPEFMRLHEQVRIEIEALSLLLEQFCAAFEAASCRHAERLSASQHEGVAFQGGRRGMAGCFRLRSGAQGNLVGRWRQIGRQREKILPRLNPESR